MVIVKHSWLDVPKWCKVIHYHGDRSDDILKYVLLSMGVKTWQKDVDLSRFVQHIGTEKFVSIDKNMKVVVLNARDLKDHKDLLRLLRLVNSVGLKAFVLSDDKESDKCMGKSHVKIETTFLDDTSSTVNVKYTHLKYGPISKEYTLKHSKDLELIHTRE